MFIATITGSVLDCARKISYIPLMSNPIEQARTEISEGLEKTLGVKGPDVKKQLRKSKSYVGVKERAAVDYLDEAEAQLKHPKLRKRVDYARVERAKRGVLRQIEGVDPSADRVKAAYFWASGLVINLCLAMAAIYFLARWVGAI